MPFVDPSRPPWQPLAGRPPAGRVAGPAVTPVPDRSNQWPAKRVETTGDIPGRAVIREGAGYSGVRRPGGTKVSQGCYPGVRKLLCRGAGPTCPRRAAPPAIAATEPAAATATDAIRVRVAFPCLLPTDVLSAPTGQTQLETSWSGVDGRAQTEVLAVPMWNRNM